MKSTTKRVAALGIVAAYALSLCSGVQLFRNGFASADTVENPSTIASNYFYDNLTIADEDDNKQEYTLAKKFYNALDEINKQGDFKDGHVEYLIPESIATSAEIQGYVNGSDLTIPKAFSAARDAFLTDHPELFYIDFYKLTISVGRANGVYKAYIDSGREANLYVDNGLDSLSSVENAISALNAKINEIVDYVNEKQASDKYSERDVYLAREVNKYIAENVTYDYAAYENKDDPNYKAAAYINTAYGALVEGKAVCGGFSTAYKTVMDRLGIPCITVNGYSNQKDQNGNENGASVYHMWNYVWLATPENDNRSIERDASGGRWYSIDVTWNNSAGNKNRFSILNASNEEKIHVTDGVISSSGYELTYPEVSKFNYGSSGETDGLQCSRIYTPTGEKDDYGNDLVNNYLSVSYNGKSAKTLLEEDGLYLVCRFAIYDGRDLHWFDWMALEPFRQYALLGVDNPYGNIDDNGIETRFYDNTSIYYTQLAVFDMAPDVPLNVNAPSLGIFGDYYFKYSSNIVNDNKSIEISKPIVNESYGTYTPPPYVSNSTPSHQGEITINDGMRDKNITTKVIMAEKNAFLIEVTYNEPLHILDENQPIGINFTSEHPNTSEYAKFFPLNSEGTIVEIVERPKNSGDPTLVPNTLRFKFAPSLMYEHNREGYTITFTNVGSAKEVTRIVDGEPVTVLSNKLPNSVYFGFGRLYLACPARFNYDGRLWIDCCAQPTLVSNSDLSEMDFKDEDGNSTFSENERSQMMLVAETASTETVDTMLDEISGDSDITVNKNDIITSETYDISLQICGKYPTIPDGSYVKIALGFPEGYGPNNAGVTFKLFHRKHIKGDEYIIEEIPCVVTQFGIVATVSSFSPYMVAVVDADKASSDKTVYTSIEGRGGKLSKADGKIKTISENGKYTCAITPDEGYQIYSVTLNHVDVTNKISNGVLTLSYSDLENNNEVEIQYIANAAAQRLVDRGNEIIAPAKVLISTSGEANVAAPSTTIDGSKFDLTTPQDNTLIIAGIVIGAVAVAVIAIVVAIFIARKRAR